MKKKILFFIMVVVFLGFNPLTYMVFAEDNDIEIETVIDKTKEVAKDVINSPATDKVIKTVVDKTVMPGAGDVALDIKKNVMGEEEPKTFQGQVKFVYVKIKEQIPIFFKDSLIDFRNGDRWIYFFILFFINIAICTLICNSSMSRIDQNLSPFDILSAFHWSVITSILISWVGPIMIMNEYKKIIYGFWFVMSFMLFIHFIFLFKVISIKSED